MRWLLIKVDETHRKIAFKIGSLFETESSKICRKLYPAETATIQKLSHLTASVRPREGVPERYVPVGVSRALLSRSYKVTGASNGNNHASRFIQRVKKIQGNFGS